MLKKFGLRQTVATILAILGSIFGLEVAIFLLLFGRWGLTLGVKEASMVGGLGWLTFYLSVIGFIGGAIVSQKPKIGGILMLLSGIGGFMAVSLAYIVASPLLIIAGILALLRKPKAER